MQADDTGKLGNCGWNHAGRRWGRTRLFRHRSQPMWLSANACLLDAEFDDALAADLLRQLQQHRPKVVGIDASEHAAEHIFHTAGRGGGIALELLPFFSTARRGFCAQSEEEDAQKPT